MSPHTHPTPTQSVSSCCRFPDKPVIGWRMVQSKCTLHTFMSAASLSLELRSAICGARHVTCAWRLQVAYRHIRALCACRMHIGTPQTQSQNPHPPLPLPWGGLDSLSVCLLPGWRGGGEQHRRWGPVKAGATPGSEPPRGPTHAFTEEKTHTHTHCVCAQTHACWPTFDVCWKRPVQRRA